jgi:uncharacterized membrane protein
MNEREGLRSAQSRGPRITSFDLARGLALAFIVMLHVLSAHASPDVWRTTYATVVGFLGSVPSAPTFMFLMGASQAFSTRTSVRKGIRRGIELLLLGYLLNLLRGTLPIIITTRLGIITLEEIAPRTATSEFWIVDILQHAGAALIILAIVRRYLPRPYQWLLLSVLVAIAAPLLWGRMTGWAVLDWLLSLLWGTDDHVIHTIFPWLSYSLVGMAAGVWISASTRRHVLFGGMILTGACLAAIAAAVGHTDPQFPAGGYPDARPIIVAWVIGLVLCWMGICHVVTSVAPTNPVFRLLYYWSKNVTTFYFIQWLLIYWGVAVVGFRKRGLTGTILSMIVVITLTDLITRLWARRRQRKVIATGQAIPASVMPSEK